MMYIIALFLLAASAILPHDTHAIFVLPTVDVDLDRFDNISPWDDAIAAVLSRHSFDESFGAFFTGANNTVFRFYDKTTIFSNIAAVIDNMHPTYAKELRGIAASFQRRGHDVSYPYLAGLAYYHDLAQSNSIKASPSTQQPPVSAGVGALVCTTTGYVMHGGTLEFSTLSPAARKLALHLRLISGGHTVLESVDFMWFTAGVLTAWRNSTVSAQTTWRSAPTDNTTILTNIQKGTLPMAWLFREMLRMAMTYNDAVGFLINTHIISSAYVIISGNNVEGSGAVITIGHNLSSLHHRNKLIAMDCARSWYLVQAATDAWETPSPSADPQKTEAMKLFDSLGRADGTTTLSMLAVMDSYPMHNENTVFTFVLVPYFSTFQWYGEFGISQGPTMKTSLATKNESLT
eukprot:PhM_4_TR987/c0_g1_i1/m.16859/K13720/NAAA; N-acylethanolamine-hydrolysing acid amidase